MSSTSSGKNGGSDRPHEVTFVAYPKLFFIWPLIFAGFAFYLLAGWMNESALEVLGWVYIVILALVLMTLGVDVNRNQAIIWAVVVAALWIGGKYLEKVQGITILGNIYAWLNGLDVRYDRGFGLATSVVLLVPFVVMLIHARLDSRWRITHNEFEHYSFGRMNDSLGRGAKTIRTDFPDVFEMLFGLAGTLIVYNATGTKELRRIPHIMFLPLVRKKLNRILERTAITAAEMEEEEDDDEDV
ncbi:MAG: hypothetical protein D6744_01450 [Planctomycetota bacterium]|nr:MAG: hypothetical protein D6744_01450 [Planctomycetota bacterium]